MTQAEAVEVEVEEQEGVKTRWSQRDIAMYVCFCVGTFIFFFSFFIPTIKGWHNFSTYEEEICIFYCRLVSFGAGCTFCIIGYEMHYGF